MAHISKVTASNDHWNQTDAGLIVVGVYSDKTFSPIGSEIDNKHNGIFSEAIKLGDVKGKKGESNLFYSDGKRFLLLGLGDKNKYDADDVRMVAGKASRILRKRK